MTMSNDKKRKLELDSNRDGGSVNTTTGSTPVAADDQNNVQKKRRVQLPPAVQKEFGLLKKTMKKRKKEWLKAADNADAKSAYRAAKKAVFEYTKKIEQLAANASDATATVTATAAAAVPIGNDNANNHKSSENDLEKQYREARRRWKKDRKNDELFQAMKRARAALDNQSTAPKQKTDTQKKTTNLTLVSPRSPQLSVDELKVAVGEAKRAWKKNRSDDTLHQKWEAAKATLAAAEASAANSTTVSSASSYSSSSYPAAAARTTATANTANIGVNNADPFAPIKRTVTDADLTNLAAKVATVKKQWKKDRQNDDLYNTLQAAKKAHEDAIATYKVEEKAAQAALATQRAVTAAANAASSMRSRYSGMGGVTSHLRSTNSNPPPAAAAAVIPANPLASLKSLDVLRQEMQDARKAWKLDRTDQGLRAVYEKAKEVFQFNETNPHAKSALATRTALQRSSQLTATNGVNTDSDGSSIKALETVMQEARRVWKIDRENKELRAAYDAAKAALEQRRATLGVSAGRGGAVMPTTNNSTGTSTPTTSGDGGARRGFTVQLANLSFEVTEDDVRGACAEVGEPTSIHWCKNAEEKFNGCALVTFATTAEATTAVQNIRGMIIQGRKTKAFLASGPATERARRVHSNPTTFVKPKEPAANPTNCQRCFVGNLNFKVRLFGF